MLTPIKTPDSLQILESVNQFYSQSFDQLMNLVIALITLIGVVVPLIITGIAWFVQKKFFKAENQEIKNSLEKELGIESALKIKEIEEIYSKKEKEFEEKILTTEEKLERKISRSLGGVFFLQGQINLDAKSYKPAFESFVMAGTHCLRGKDERNLVAALVSMKNCLPKLHQADLNIEEGEIEKYNRLIQGLTDYDKECNGGYSRYLEQIKAEYKKAVERTNSTSK